MSAKLHSASVLETDNHEPHSCSVIIADDDAPMITLLTTSLRRLGHKILASAKNGKDAVDLAAQFKPELMILDVEMPVLDGIEAAKQILAVRDVPIIFSTAAVDDRTMAKLRGFKFGAYLVKPFSPAQLKAAIHVAVFQRH